MTSGTRTYVSDVGETIANVLKIAAKCCPNCEHFERGKEVCGLNRKRPPANVIAFGCECFREVEIPF